MDTTKKSKVWIVSGIIGLVVGYLLGVLLPLRNRTAPAAVSNSQKPLAAVSNSQKSLPADWSNLDKLAHLQFTGNVRFKFNDEFVYAYHPQEGQIGAPYPWHFFLSPKSKIPGGTFVKDANTAFGVSVGSDTGGVTGYWVRYPPGLTIQLAWQAIPGNRFSFWNEDGKRTALLRTMKCSTSRS